MTTELSTPRFCIAVLDRGFVYVGTCVVHDGVLTITGAHCVRRWGTENGLGQLAQSGPTAKTRLDATGTVRTPQTALIHLSEADAAKFGDIAQAA